MITYDITYKCEGLEKSIEFKSSYSREAKWERDILYDNATKFVKAREFGKDITIEKIAEVDGEKTQWSTGRSRTLEEIRSELKSSY